MINTNDLERNIRDLLIEQSGIDARFVRNSLSLYGSALDQSDYNNIWSSIQQEQSLVLFEISSRDSTNNMSESNDDNTILLYNSFQVHVIIYGLKARDLSGELIARLKTAYCRSWLSTRDIFLEEVSYPTSVNDFKNGSIWPRTDFDIDITCRFTIQPVYSESNFAKYGDIIIENIEEAGQNVVQQN